MKQLFLIVYHVFEVFDDTAGVFDFHGSSSSCLHSVCQESLDFLNNQPEDESRRPHPLKIEKSDDEDRSETRHKNEKSNPVSFQRELMNVSVNEFKSRKSDKRSFVLLQTADHRRINDEHRSCRFLLDEQLMTRSMTLRPNLQCHIVHR